MNMEPLLVPNSRGQLPICLLPWPKEFYPYADRVAAIGFQVGPVVATAVPEHLTEYHDRLLREAPEHKNLPHLKAMIERWPQTFLPVYGLPTGWRIAGDRPLKKNFFILNSAGQAMIAVHDMACRHKHPRIQIGPRFYGISHSSCRNSSIPDSGGFTFELLDREGRGVGGAYQPNLCQMHIPANSLGEEINRLLREGMISRGEDILDRHLPDRKVPFGYWQEKDFGDSLRAIRDAFRACESDINTLVEAVDKRITTASNGAKLQIVNGLKSLAATARALNP